MTDEMLVKLYAGGNNSAFDILLERYEEKIFSYIFFIVHNQDVADDIFQETFMKAVVDYSAGTLCGKMASFRHGLPALPII